MLDSEVIRDMVLGSEMPQEVKHALKKMEALPTHGVRRTGVGHCELEKHMHERKGAATFMCTAPFASPHGGAFLLQCIIHC